MTIDRRQFCNQQGRFIKAEREGNFIEAEHILKRVDDDFALGFLIINAYVGLQKKRKIHLREWLGRRAGLE